MLLIDFIILSSIAINLFADAEINPTECVADWLVINRGYLSKQRDDIGQYFLDVWPEVIFDQENDQEDRRRFDELVAKCVGEERVQMSEDGLRRMVDVWQIRQENEDDYGDPFYVSRQLGYVSHTIKCVANYASAHYENAKTDMVKPRMIRVIADSLPDIVHSGMDGFEELKECIEKMEKPKDDERSLIGKMSSLFGIRKENMEGEDECIFSENDQNKERLSSPMTNFISVQSLKQNTEINRILQKHLFPTKKINDQIVAEMHCAGEFLVTKMMVKTQMELKQGNEDISVRRVVKPKEPIGQDAEQWYREHCAGSVVRRNAMGKHGLGGMLEASYGTIYLGCRINIALDELSVHLADSLAIKFMSSGGVDIVRLNARADVFMAWSINTSLFRIQIQREKCDLNHKISENSESSLYKYIMESMDSAKFKDWEQKTVAELLQMFDENYLFLSKQFLNNYLVQNKGQESILYSNITCIADFMVIYEGIVPRFDDNGKIVPDWYSELVKKDQIGEEAFTELTKCVGEDWVKNINGEELFSVHGYFRKWGTDKYQVSEELERLLVNLDCMADYLVFNDENVRIKNSLLYDMKIDEKTMPQSIRREVENSEQFDKMVQCMKEPNGNYQILGNVVPSLLRYKDGPNGDKGVRFQLKEPNNPIMEKLLSHAYISEEIVRIIRAKFSCIVSALIEEGNARTSLIRDQKLHKVLRKVAIRNLPENLLEETGCGQIFRNEDDREWKLEQRLNRDHLYYMVVDEMIITDEQLLQKLDLQSMCISNYLATLFWPKYVENIADHHLKYLAQRTGTIMFRFNFPNDLEFREKLKQFLRNTETAQEFTKCVPKLANIPEDHFVDTFMAHLELFNQDQLFLSNEFDLFGCLADWLASKFGPKYIAKINSNEEEILYWPGISNYKLFFENTDEFYAELKRKLHNVKSNDEFKKLAKCLPEIKLPKADEIMAGASGELLYNKIRDHLDNLDAKYLCLSDKFSLANCLPDYHPTKDEIDTEDICSICHEEFDEKNVAKRLPNCKHLYHADCIKYWLDAHNRCPYCSATIFT